VLDSLIEKYAQMLRMRELDRDDSDRDPREQMASLARRFPGALREIDERPIDDISARLHELREASAGRREVPAWAQLQSAYHGAMRAFLRVRPLARGGSEQQARDAVADGYRQTSPDEPTPEAVLGVLPQLRDPPKGRLNPIAFSYVAELYGVTADEVTAALFKSADCH